jgi:polyisoprenoid-binding protein YceI
MKSLIAYKRFLLTGLFFCMVISANWAQNKNLLELKKGKIIFMSYAPQEIIKAESDELKGLINIDNSTFAIVVNNSTFNGFNSELQREHFNERFIETEKYNSCTYSGKIIEKIDLSKDGTYQVRTRGKLTVHGISEDRVILVTIKVVSGSIIVSGKFIVSLSDHEISIPAIVNQKIAENIEVNFTALFEKK